MIKKCISNCCEGFKNLTIDKDYEVLDIKSSVSFRTPENEGSEIMLKIVDDSGVENFYPAYCFI